MDSNVRKIIVNEQQMREISDRLFCESISIKVGFSVDPRKVKVVKDYLDKGFKRASMAFLGDDGYSKTAKLVGMIGDDGNVLRNMTDRQLFYLLQDRFSKIDQDKGKRDRLLRQIIKDWYKKLISDDGLLSVNSII